MLPIHNRIFSLAALCALLACGCAAPGGGSSSADQAPGTVLAIGTADSGGTMYPVGSAIAQAISGADDQIKVNVAASTGSTMNVQDLASGQVDLALVSGDVAYSAVQGTDVFPQPQEGLRVLAAVFSSESVWMAPESLGAEYVHDLAGESIGVGPQVSTSELSARAVAAALALEDQGTQLVNCSLGEGAERVARGELAAIHGFTGNPVPGLLDLSRALPCRVLRYTDGELAEILAENHFYYPAVIPAGAYAGQEEEIPTFGVKCLLCVDASMSDQLAYELTQILWEGAEELGRAHPAMAAMADRAFLYEGLTVPLHPGAQAFYQDRGVL